MAVRVIEKGRPRWQDMEWRVRCYGCQSLFSFMGSDAKRWSSVRNEEGLQIDCPECGKTHYTEHLTPPPVQRK